MAMRGLRNIGLKVLSIGLAVLLWLIVAGEQLVERALRIPLELTNVPEHLEIVGETTNVVDVRVRGSSGAIGRVAGGELVAVLDLSEAKEGQRILNLTPSNVRVPFGVEVVQIAPSNVSMRFERSTTKTVPVVPHTEGSPADGFVIGTVRATPPTVELAGGASVLATVTEAVTEPVSVAGRAASFTEEVAIGSPDPLARLRTPQTAQVSVTVTAAPIEWIVEGVTIQIRNAASRTTVSPRTVDVYVRGPQNAQQITADDIDAWVDVDGLPRGKYPLTVRIQTPERIGVIRVDPERATVTVQ
jgi:YbbR domain-containing protein